MQDMKWLSFLLLVSMTSAYKLFQDSIPNGVRVPDPCISAGLWAGVGHKSKAGGGDRNPFGLDFKANGKKWDQTLCKMDSDGDGKTNGEELGDPNCDWSPGKEPFQTTGLSNPGICEPIDSPKCEVRNNWDICKTPKEFECDDINDPDVLKLEVRGPITRIPKKETSYSCILVDVPTEGDFHIIAVEPLINNSNVMHHMILYGCDDNPDVERYINHNECFQVPDSCNENYAGWTLGDVGTCFNGPYGIRLGEKGKKKALLQYHWTNIEHKEDYMDNSGFKIYYTPKLRENDLGSFTVGQTELTIPPKQEHIELGAICKSECTKQTFSEPVYFIQGNLHMHYLGSSGGIELFRDGKKLQNLLWQDKYAYDTPYYENYEPDIEFRPGDSIKLTCIYDSTSRTNTTTFGPGTRDEMCFGFMMYYPKVKNAYCGQHGDYDVCINSGNTCSAASFIWSKEAEDAYNDIDKACHAYSCLPGCATKIQQLQEKHACFKPGKEFAKYIRELYNQMDPKRATTLFQMLVSCGLKPSEAYAKQDQEKELPMDKLMPKPGEDEIKGQPPNMWSWKDQLEYMKQLKAITCGSPSMKAWNFGILTLTLFSLFFQQY